MFFVASHGVGATLKGDAESTAHVDKAASLDVVEKESLTDFIFRQYNLAVLSHYSYLIGSGGEAMIVDPARDVDRYVKDAKELGLKITRVYLTHSHADFVAGHMELMKATGADIVVNNESGAKYRHVGVADNKEILFGNVRAVVRTTPGHTPDGTCLYIYHPARSSEPKMVLTGDTLFVGSVGRPDLLEGTYTSAQLASLLFDTWNNKLSRVPDETKIYPAHGAGSLCGVHLSDQPVSTFGEQKKTNPYLQHKDRATFVMAVIDGLREPPQYFKHNAAMNREGPAVLGRSKNMPPALSSAQVSEMAEKGAWIVDLRDQKDFASGHVPGAINIHVRGRFETWAGIIIPWGAPFIIVGPEEDVAEAAFRLNRIGYDNPAGYLKDDADAWRKAGLSTHTLKLVSPQQLYRQMQEGKGPIVVDVRQPHEWMARRIGDVLNMPLDRLSQEARRLEPNMPLLMVCNSAYRSSLAASIMQKLGFREVMNLEGGTEAWINAGLPTYGSDTTQNTVPAPVYINLPERMTPEELAHRLMDLPGTIEVVDIRPAWQFNEYHIPGSSNVAVEELIGNSAYLGDKRPLIIVCRDGSISAAVGGALIQKASRPIRYLSGGAMRYYDEILRPRGIISDRRTPVSPSVSGAPVTGPGPEAETGQRPTPAPPTPATPPVKKKKSAGC
jgi:rhodanese-related sulfurtransferase/glyoxylase-like metal-dependent hydrolase (beta-lactamase superfamily II)